MLILADGTIFLCDTQINVDPDAGQLVEMTQLAASALRRFGVVPRAALVSHSSFGSADTPSARKMRQAAQMLWQQAPELEVEGEMQGDAALSHAVRERVFPESHLSGDANLLIMPNLDAANITLNCLRVASSNGVTVGPILLGTAKPAHVLLPQTTVRGLINMTVMTAAG
jgi:malate dehydrogenase (oxaloacetate-decarboxylating)(NADP+)